MPANVHQRGRSDDEVFELGIWPRARARRRRDRRGGQPAQGDDGRCREPANPSPIVMDSFSNMSRAFAALINISDIDHFDLVDDPFVVAYRAQGGITRAGAFDPNASYVLRPLEERQQIRDHYVLAALDAFLKGSGPGERFAGDPYSDRGVSVTLERE